MLMKEDDKTGDIFQCTLGNLPPKTDATISFKYVIELPQEPDGKIRFTLPTVLNPRYSPGIVIYTNTICVCELWARGLGRGDEQEHSAKLGCFCIQSCMF